MLDGMTMVDCLLSLDRHTSCKPEHLCFRLTCAIICVSQLSLSKKCVDYTNPWKGTATILYFSRKLSFTAWSASICCFIQQMQNCMFWQD